MGEAAPTVIVLTPVLNEAWVLDCFLRCAGTWADHIVVADQGSDDGSVEIGASHPKVTLVHNREPGYDEAARQRLLIETARAIPVSGRRIMIALDADELMTSDPTSSPEWDRVLAAPPGTVLWFDWVNVAPGWERAWIDAYKTPFGFVDDGRPHTGEKIHSRRIPTPADAPALRLEEIKILHLQYVDWERMKSKQRWYQCWERVNLPEKRPITLYRQYHHMDAGLARATPMQDRWTAGYRSAGIEMPDPVLRPPFRWDAEVLDLFQKHGLDSFRRLDVWDVDWSAINEELGRPMNGFADPRSPFDRAVHSWLSRTQSGADRPHVRVIQRLLRLANW